MLPELCFPLHHQVSFHILLGVSNARQDKRDNGRDQHLRQCGICAHAEASLARARLEIEEKSERATAAARRNADAQAAAAVAHTEEIKKAVNAERKRAEDQVAELVASYGGKIRMIEAEFTRSASRVEAAEQTATAKTQLVEESNRQVAEAERRASVLQAEAERCNEHAADMERRAASASKLQREAEAKIARADSERGAASRRSMHLEGELSRAQAQIESLTKDRDEASEQLSTLDQRIAEVTAAAARMQEEALTAQSQMKRQASDAIHAAEIRVRTEMQSVLKDKEAEIGELHRDIQELRQLAAAAQRDHEKVAGEVEQELHALAAQHREVVAALEERVRLRLEQSNFAYCPQCVSNLTFRHHIHCACHIRMPKRTTCGRVSPSAKGLLHCSRKSETSLHKNCVSRPMERQRRREYHPIYIKKLRLDPSS